MNIWRRTFEWRRCLAHAQRDKLLRCNFMTQCNGQIHAVTNPATHHIRIESMRECNTRQRRSSLAALSHYLSLKRIAVTASDSTLDCSHINAHF